MPQFLPTTLTRFIGRESALASLHALFSGGSRFVTLFGPGGIGKTRLALAYAARHAPGGMLFFDLTDARSVEDVCRIVALAMGLRLDAAQGLDDVVASIEGALALSSCAVVAFDNCEQLDADAVAALGAWCNGSTGAVLVTSRTLLGLPGEHAFEVPSLELPSHDEDSEAARLFVDRARLVRADYDPTADAEIIAAIVKTLEGVPLAIELAAGCLDVYSPATLLSRLHRPLDELTSRARVTVPRHASLRAALEPSWQRLEPWEKTALAAMSVFHGGFSIEGAEAVIDVGSTPNAPRVASILSTLRAKSLLRAYDDQGARRFALYEGVRQFADEHLDPSERAGAETRHTAYFRSLAERALDPAATDLTARNDALIRDLGNVHAMFQRADAVTAWIVILALDLPFRYRGASRELSRMCALAMERKDDGGGDPRLHARAYAVWARIVQMYGGGDALAITDEALALATAAKDDAALGRVRLIQAIEHNERTPGESQPLTELVAALELSQRAKDYPNEILVMKFLADLSRRANDDESVVMKWCEQALARARAVGDVDGEITVLNSFALIELSFDHLQPAARLIEQVLEKARPRGASMHVSEALYYRGAIRRQSGDLRASLADFDAAYTAGAEIRSAYAPLILAEGAVVLHELGELERAIARYEEALPQLRELRLPGVRQARATTYAFLGDALAWVGNDARADDAFGEARELAPGAPHAETVLALLAAHRGLARSQDHAARDAARLTLEQAPAFIQDDTVRVARRMLERTLKDPSAPAVASPRAAMELLVGPQSRWVQLPPNERVELVGVLLRTFMTALVERRLERAGEPLTVEKLLAVGWPGERMNARAGKLRVWNVIARLRGLGLRDVLLTIDDGYLIDARVTVVRAGA